MVYETTILYLIIEAQDSTSTRCVVGTSSLLLRMLTESGDVVIYVFSLSAGLRPFILDVQGGVEPIFSSWEFVGFGVGRAAMSLYQSQLATTCGVCMSGWTVCNRSDKSRDSGMAIS